VARSFPIANNDSLICRGRASGFPRSSGMGADPRAWATRVGTRHDPYGISTYPSNLRNALLKADEDITQS
jgi:hypothetical protein